MRKFKLIKEYPGSPKLGTMVKIGETCTIFIGDTLITIKSISNYPDFWQEIIEKYYEILSFHDNFNKYYKKENGKFTINLQYEYTIDDLLNKKDLKIYSVKRLSDGEVFTVGDTINIGGKNRILEQIFIMKDTSLFYCYTDNKKHCWSVDDIEKAKQPLFTTEDGVDIYEDDQYWFIYNFQVKSTKAHKIGNYYPLPNFYYSTKEAAEEYIIMNKPCLSINDVIICYESPKGSPLHNRLINNLKQLVKSKL